METARVRPPVVRRTHDRVVTGVAAGIADHLGVDRRWVRTGFAVAAVFGVGIVVYLIAALVTDGDDGSAALARRWRPRDTLDFVAVAAIAIGGITLARAFAPSGPAVLLVPVIVAAIALALLVSWPATATGDHVVVHGPRWLPPAAATALGVLGTRRGLLLRVALGGLLALTGTAVLVASSATWQNVRTAVLALIVVVAGVALVFGPWLGRLSAELVGERRERIRSDERAAMAAHLHDSVLQTLALVQRHATEPNEVVRLARKQERELRAWLLEGKRADAPATTFAAAITAYAAQLEDDNGVAVEVVNVRDCPLDERLHETALAAREAIVNAQRHARVDRVAVYTEVEPHEVRVYVRDRGVGFDRDAVPPGRGGLSESIEGRMRRLGGRAIVRSAPGKGTEVELVMPRVDAAAVVR
jgi:signal transduction histidine kinase/phage shock protein PspC (stress-responsive transcriptional regulator)